MDRFQVIEKKNGALGRRTAHKPEVKVYTVFKICQSQSLTTLYLVISHTCFQTAIGNKLDIYVNENGTCQSFTRAINFLPS